ncbi:hypothetical protein C7H19_09485 [Aphanothece hegewaldii CCALA 016]|uniref:Uncharacterized protein n=1 Tax=Aphanothece hegewaldii CCALA 016 TaxID=2107694 RepID=A0A2T1LZC7_9CHRO|nr:hypothetical protein [Aphanothece hegewaldii]PSF37765.1 hypothetical protein C7H19_09485 [Aphanothece hegewaldii CCALA 016]
MNNNERFSLGVILLSCVIGMGIMFLPENKAVLYASIPSSMITSAFTYLGIKNDRNSNGSN